MKVDVLSLDGKKSGQVDLPVQFEEEYRPNLIKRAILALYSRLRQPYGADPRAGLKYSAKLSRRRGDYKGAYKHGISRVPRKTMWRRGTQFGWQGAEAPGTIGGRRAHPPKATKIWDLKINKKERRLAIRSAITAAKSQMLVLDSKVEEVSKTKDVQNVFIALGLKQELKRLNDKKVRPGKGSNRGRKYQKKVGPLVVVSKDCKLIKSGRNFNGVEVVEVNKLNASLLTSGHHLVRKSIWTKDAVEKLGKEKLFI